MFAIGLPGWMNPPPIICTNGWMKNFRPAPRTVIGDDPDEAEAPPCHWPNILYEWPGYTASQLIEPCGPSYK
jgi:hypothetical protein